MVEKRDHKIYLYTNKVNGKKYVGRTCRNIQARAGVNGKGYKGCKYFYNAINKYGWDNFECIILEDNLTAKEASEKEIYYINKYKSCDSNIGYNIISSIHFNYDEEFREGASKAGKKFIGENNPFFGKHHTEETKEYFRKLFIGKHHTEEAKKKMSESRKGKYTGKDNSMFGKHHTEEAKKKMSESRKGQRSHMLGKHHSKEAREKISKSVKGRVLSEETKKKMSVGRKDKKAVMCVETKVIYESIKEASRIIGCSPSAIARSCKGLNRVKGYHYIFYIK